MEITIKMNRDEMRTAIESGSLMALLEAGEKHHCEEGTCRCQDTLASVPQDLPAAAPEKIPAAEPQKPQANPQVPVAPQAAPIGSPVATTTMTYQLDDLAQAAMGLMQQDMQAQLQDLLKQFGVEALPQLPKEQYGAFATALRGMGAQI